MKAHFQNFTARSRIRRGLPAAAYTGADFHAAENARLFARRWVFAGFAHEVPRRGDVAPVVVGGRPVLLAHGGGGIRAFHNVCSHRCLQLVDARAHAGKLIRCPYHSWAYDFDGALRATPFFGGDADAPPGFDRGAHGLQKIACEVWHDWGFVHLDDGAMPFADFIAPLAEQLAHVDFAQLTPVATLDFGAVHCNWKFLMENFIEPYHVQFVHASTTEQPLQNHAAFIDRHCLGCKVRLPQKQNAARADTLSVDSNYFTLFPNFVLATYAPNQLGVHCNTPLDAARTQQRRVIYLPRGADAREIDALKKLWRKVHREDHAICERLQRGRASPLAAGGGVLSPVWERAVRRFQELVYDAVAAAQPPADSHSPE